MYRAARKLPTLRLTFLAVVPVALWLGSPARASSLRNDPTVLAVQKAQPAVVNISSEKTVIGRNGWAADPNEPQRVNGMGSGVIVDERGYIITNAHVVDKVTSLRVRLADGAVHSATAIATDRATDLALLKIDPGKRLLTIPMGTSSDLMIGETVIAVGNAYGYENTVTRGVVSAIGRTVRLNEEMTYYDLIQTDASINPGNSGGALLNIDGDLVGINVAIRAGAQGISFAIPVDTVRKIAANMMSIQRINHTWHGVDYQEVADPTTNRIELAVQRVQGPAQKCGFQTGDHVLQVGETKIQNAVDFERSLLGNHAGDRTTVVVRRGQHEQTLELTIEELPNAAETTADIIWRRLGLRLSVIELYQVQRFQPQLNGGMYVNEVQVGSSAATAGVRPGDVLVGLQKWETLSYDNVAYVLATPEAAPAQPLMLHLLRNGERQELQVRLSPSKNTSISSRR